MKGYKKIHRIAKCRECDWNGEGFLEARKHHKETGHIIDLEMGLHKVLGEWELNKNFFKEKK